MCLKRHVLRALVFGVFAVLLSERSDALDAGPESRRIVIENDRGGLVGRRVRVVSDIRRSGRLVEIRGRVCLSSCTLYLGAGNVCVAPNVRFGFHGPSYYGSRLTQRDFDYWSRVISDHYPGPLRSWYMKTARFRLGGFYYLLGSELIRLGVPACSQARR